jgi:drug/metabolite transporter (DMT)-like permease
MVPAMIVNALVVSFVGLAFSSSFYLPFDSLIYVIAGGILLAIAFSLITLAPRFIPASEVAMFMPLGTIFGILSAWLVINEQPSSSSLLGGSIVVITLFFHAWYSSKLQTK